MRLTGSGAAAVRRSAGPGPTLTAMGDRGQGGGPWAGGDGGAGGNRPVDQLPHPPVSGAVTSRSVSYGRTHRPGDCAR